MKNSNGFALSEAEKKNRLVLARRILESSPPDKFDSVVSDLQLLAPDLPEDWSNEVANRFNEKHTLPFVRNAWNSFFHSRTTPQACLLGGWLRMAFAVIFVADRLLLTLDFRFFYHPTEGVIPYHPEYDDGYTIFSLAPESYLLLWTIHCCGILQGMLLFLGIAPRFQLCCIFGILVSFKNHSDNMLYDSQDNLMRTLAWLLCLLPLHRLGISEWHMSAAERREICKKDSWPMWPFRVVQIQMCFVFMGAGIGKVVEDEWLAGTAMYFVVHEDNFFGGPFTPDFIYNRVLPLKLLTWASLALELSCSITIWPQATRMPTLVAMILFHLGIDLAMNLNSFQWLMMVGWLTFLAKPNQSQPRVERKTNLKRVLANVFIVVFLILFSIETCPINLVVSSTPKMIRPYARSVGRLQNRLKNKYVRSLLRRLGIDQQVWAMYGDMDHVNVRTYGTITHSDGSQTKWSQPDWNTMTVWQKKRHHRQVLYYDSITESWDGGEFRFRWALCQYLARIHGPDVETIRLWRTQEVTPEFPSDLGWWDPAKQEMIDQGEKTLYIWEAEDDEEDRDDSDSDDEDDDEDDDGDGDEENDEL
mmetsp:Transcript_15832/g.34406  ORF Transcript_15832/g.34406 Transcript_15832/m.34406 type:complete len:588 (-) Transcript_15832:1463-3226(-)